MKAIRTINENKKFVEWVHIMDDGSLATCAIPSLLGEYCTLEDLAVYYKKNLEFEFNPNGLAVEIVDVDLVVREDMSTAVIQDENERKWVMKMLPSVKWDDKIYIDQYYMMHDGRNHRVRFNYENDVWYRTTSGKQERKLRSIEFIHKEKVGKGKNKEHHTVCTYEQAKELIKNATKRITKVRHVHYDDVKYEVDVFLNSVHQRGGFIMMEVEVADLEQELFIPDRIREVMLEEVTGDEAYDNYKMAVDPGITD